MLSSNAFDRYADAMGNLGHHIVEDSGRGHDYHVVEKAIQYYNEGLRVMPGHTSIAYNLGIAYERQGKRQEAYDAYQVVLKQNSMHIGANLNAGNLCMYAGLHNLSLALHRRALKGYELNGHDPWWQIGLLNNMGQTLLMMFEPGKAMDLYHQALMIDANDAMTLFNLFKVRRQMCDWDGWDSISVPQMITRTTHDFEKGPNTTMMPYDVTLLPVNKQLILNVAKSNLLSFQNLTPPQRTIQAVKLDQQLGEHWKKRSLLKKQSTTTIGTTETTETIDTTTTTRKRLPLNVAYYGYDFNNHPMGHLTLGLFERHHRQKVRVQCAPYGSDDHVSTCCHDRKTNRSQVYLIKYIQKKLSIHLVPNSDLSPAILSPGITLEPVICIQLTFFVVFSQFV